MKKFTTSDESSGYVSAKDEGLTLAGVYLITDWTDEQFDQIACMEVHQKINFDGICVKRTE